MSEKLRYWNTIIGISLVVNADEYFFKALPILNPMVYQSFFLEEEWYFKIAYFSVTELIFRIILTLIFVLGAVKGRLVILSFCTLVVYGRTAPFIFDTKTVNTKIQLVVFEGLKCFTQVPVSLVFFDAYKNNFTSAYSGYMVMYSVVNFIFTGLLHLVSHLSDSLKTMEYICIAAYAICVIIWTLEFTVFRKKPITNGQNLNEINKA
ncbi:hypothetical protein ABEB36_002631 [Hypothenemus hampei]|uniref:Uncharacterized protein n=1 Tax=Hypothenemus hampei TaxID=57062 RepID=A0ABD1F6F6_HYPHA